MAYQKNNTRAPKRPLLELSERKAFVIIDKEGQLEHQTFAPSKSLALKLFGLSVLPTGFRCIRINLSKAVQA